MEKELTLTKKKSIINTMKNKILSFLIIGVVLLVIAVLIKPCFAAFSLSVTPYEGGYDLRFGKLDTQDAKVVKELTITITTDIAKQYRVFQRLDKTLTTPDGIDVGHNQLKMYTLTNSNSKGTLEWIEEIPLMSSDTVLYTSDTAGDGDSFKIVYTLEPSVDQVAGSYYGRLIFILRPIDSAQEETIQTINMYADLTNEGAVDISTDSGFKSIRISSRDLKEEGTVENRSVNIAVKGNLGTRYNLYQQLDGSLLKSSNAEPLDLTKVRYKITDVNSGAIVKEGDLSELKSKALVYLSDDLGSAGNIKVEYSPAQDFPMQKADTYRGLINYYLELDRTAATLESGLLDSVDMECEVEPVFDIAANYVTAEGQVIQESLTQLEFGEVDYHEGAKEKRVSVKVKSNLGKPYSINQKVGGPLQNEQGDRIPDELFTFKVEKKETTSGKLKFEEELVVDSTKDMAIFVSDTNGDSDEFDIVYKLKATSDIRGGTYTTGISYSLSEL